MSKISKFTRAALCAGSALQALTIVSVSVAAIAISAPAMAQDYTNVNASGKVIGTDGKAIAGATVEITSAKLGFKQSVVTDRNGSYRIPQIPAGDYTFVVSADGYDAFPAELVTLSADGAANQFVLATTTDGDEIVVTAGRAEVVDFERTTTGQVLDIGELATRVPIARDITSVVQLAPGTTLGDSAFGNSVGSTGSLPNIAGASVGENIYYINGLNVTNFRTGLGAADLPFEFYQTVEVKTGGYPAEFGRGTGGVINAVTKTGSNQFHGGVTFTYEPDALTSDAPNTIAADNDADERKRTDTVVQLSGPIIKDRLFFYGIYNFINASRADGFRNLVGAPSPTATFTGNRYQTLRSTSPFYGFKLDGIIADGHRVEFTYFDSRRTSIQDVFGTAASAVRYNPTTNEPGSFAGRTVYRDGGINWVGRYTGKFADWITVSGAYGKNKFSDTTEAARVDQSSIIDSRTANPISIGNPTANSELNFDKREFYRGDVDLFFSFLGKHHVRFGYDRENLSTDIVTRANGAGQITYFTATSGDPYGFATGTQYALTRFFLNGGTFKSRNEAFYIQDSWSLFNDRLNLNLGLRNDRFTNNTIAGVPFYKSGNQYGPRVSFTLDAFGDGRTKVSGSFGRYFYPIAANTNNRLGGAELDYDQFSVLTSVNSDGTPVLGARLTPTGGSPCLNGVTGSCVVRSNGIPNATDSLISTTLKSQSLDEYILGVEHRFGSKWKVSVALTKRDLNRALEDSAIDGAVQAFCTANNIPLTNADQTGCADIFNGTHQYVLINPGSSVTVPLTDRINGEANIRTLTFTPEQLGYPAAKRSYKALTVKFDREFDGVWSLSGSYTLSKTEGNYEGAVRSDNGQDDAGGTTDFDLPGLSVGSFGPSPNDRRHNFKLFGSYQVTDWLNVGASGTLISPRKFGCLGLVPASVDPIANAFYGANGAFCNLDSSGNVITSGTTTPSQLQVVPRGSAFKSDWLKNVNLDVALKVPSDLFEGTFRISVFNVFNSQAKLDFEERGTTGTGQPRSTYRQVLGFQQPRSVRFQLGVNF
jgi:Carboxypeptidase regulatory-like domain/TonB-dependent Receptor Plug Domain